jgi:hypothetical protein
VPMGSAFPTADDPQGYGKLSDVSGRTTRIPSVAPSRRLFGYGSEMSTVVDAIAGEKHRGALIIGAAGVGKTALVNAALSRLDADLSVTRLRGSESARARNLGIFEILLSREGIRTDLPPGRALSVIGDLFERRSAEGRLSRRSRQCRSRRRSFSGGSGAADGCASDQDRHRCRIRAATGRSHRRAVADGKCRQGRSGRNRRGRCDCDDQQRRPHGG